MPTVGEVSLLPPVLLQAGGLTNAATTVSQSTQKSPNSLGSSKAKPAPGARAASASAKGPGEGPKPLVPGWSSVLVLSPWPALCQGVSPWPALCQAVQGALGAGQTWGGQHGAHCQPGCPSVRAQILPPRVALSINK